MERARFQADSRRFQGLITFSAVEQGTHGPVTLHNTWLAVPESSVALKSSSGLTRKGKNQNKHVIEHETKATPVGLNVRSLTTASMEARSRFAIKVAIQGVWPSTLRQSIAHLLQMHSPTKENCRKVE
jgi:uncharacterized membrane protein